MMLGHNKSYPKKKKGNQVTGHIEHEDLAPSRILTTTNKVKMTTPKPDASMTKATET